MSRKFIPRASSLGKLMKGIHTEPLPLTAAQEKKLQELRKKGSKSKERERLEKKLVEVPESVLSAGALSHIRENYYERKYKYRKQFSNKYTRKGNKKEAYSITQLNEILGVMAVKNEKYHNNGYTQGTPDIILKNPDCIIDAKNVWWPEGLQILGEPEDDGYIWQVKCYCWLTGKTVGYVARILVNPPAPELESQAWQMWRAAGNEGHIDDEFMTEVVEMFDWERKLPLKDRVSLHKVVLEDKDIKAIKTACELANEEWERLHEVDKSREVKL